MLIVTSPAGQRGFRREATGWSELADGAPVPLADASPVEELLALLTDRIAAEVMLEPPPSLQTIATVQLLDFAGEPLELIEIAALPDGRLVAHGFDAPGDPKGVWRVYATEGSSTPPLLTPQGPT